MNIFGVGPLEIIVVLVISLLVLGPEGMVKAGRLAGKYLRKLYASEFWRAVRGSGDLWGKLSQDLGFSDELDEIRSGLPQENLPNIDNLDEYRSSVPRSRPRAATNGDQNADDDVAGEQPSEGDQVTEQEPEGSAPEGEA